MIGELKLQKIVQNLSELTIWGKNIYTKKYKLIAMNFDVPSEKDLICNYINPTTTKIYQGPPEDSGKQLIIADDETSPNI